MYKKTTFTILFFSIILMVFKPTAIAQSQVEHPVKIFIQLPPTPSDQAGLIATVKQLQGRTTHTFPSQALIAQVPANLTGELRNHPDVIQIFSDVIPSESLASFDADLRRWALVWNNLIKPPAPDPATLQAFEEHPIEEEEHAFIAPDLPTGDIEGLAGAATVTPGYYQTSEYMAGSVAVGIVLVESDGSGDPSTEDWTEEEKQTVFNEIVTGLNWWTEMEPRANLSFVYDDHFSNPLPTSIEPISQSYTYQQYWIADAMGALGYSATSYYTRVRDYNNDLRDTYQTDWAFTIFVVDSSTDSDNRFSDGLFAYAYLGGPFTVMTYGNNGYGASNMDAVIAHEVGHIFHARDQYSSAYQSCTLTAGYLDVENQNSQYGDCLSNETSIMRGQIYPFFSKAIDSFAAGQIGWRDSDGDDILDPLDTTLPVSIDTFNQTDNTIVAGGSANVVPYPSPAHTSVTINRLTGIQYRISGGIWQPAQASDGLYDGTGEDYTLTATNIAPGMHTLEVAALDSAGNVSDTYASQSFFVRDPVDDGLNTQFYPSQPIPIDSQATIQGVAYDLDGQAISQVEYRFNGGEWQPTPSADGAYDSDFELFNLTIDTTDLEPGLYSLEARATSASSYVEANIASESISIIMVNYSLYVPLVQNR